MTTKAILFDFWGTLVENGARNPTKGTLFILRIPNDYKDFIVPFEEIFFAKDYPTQEEAFHAVCAHFNVKPYPIVISKLVGLWNKNKLFAKPYEDTVETLQALKDKGIKLAIVSNANKGAVEDVIAKHNLAEYFDAVIISYQHGMLKQGGELYDIALKQLGVAKKDTLVIGDSIETDMAGAEKAGIKAILIDRRGTREYADKIAALKEIESKL